MLYIKFYHYIYVLLKKVSSTIKLDIYSYADNYYDGKIKLMKMTNESKI